MRVFFICTTRLSHLLLGLRLISPKAPVTGAPLKTNRCMTSPLNWPARLRPASDLFHKVKAKTTEHNIIDLRAHVNLRACARMWCIEFDGGDPILPSAVTQRRDGLSLEGSPNLQAWTPTRLLLTQPLTHTHRKHPRAHRPMISRAYTEEEGQWCHNRHNLHSASPFRLQADSFADTLTRFFLPLKEDERLEYYRAEHHYANDNMHHIVSEIQIHIPDPRHIRWIKTKPVWNGQREIHLFVFMRPAVLKG